MTNPTTLNVEGIARGLTKAGAIIVIRMRPKTWHEAYYLRSSQDVWAPAATLAALARKGLVEVNPATAYTQYRLTASGLAVRAALLKEKDHG